MDNCSPAGSDASGSHAEPDKSLYQTDLEERARLLQTTVEAVRQQDDQLLSAARPSEACLHPDEVMLCASNPRLLPHYRYEHFEGCQFCRGLVAFARPSPERVARMAKHLAGLAAEPLAEPQPKAPRVVRWTESTIGAVDRAFAVVWRGAPVLACGLCLYFVVPGIIPVGFQAALPAWLWTDHQLSQSAAKVLEKGNSQEAYTLANELVKRDPGNLNGRYLRYQALVKGGNKEQAAKEASVLFGELVQSLQPKDQAAALAGVAQSVVLKTRDDPAAAEWKIKALGILQSDLSKSVSEAKSITPEQEELQFREALKMVQGQNAVSLPARPEKSQKK
jgi:hypothetical protein